MTEQLHVLSQQQPPILPYLRLYQHAQVEYSQPGFKKIITEATFKKLEKNFSGLCYRIIAFSLETCGHSIEYAAQRNSCITLSNAAPP